METHDSMFVALSKEASRHEKLMNEANGFFHSTAKKKNVLTK